MTAGWFRLVLHLADVAVSDALHGQVTYSRGRGERVRPPVVVAAPPAGQPGGAS